MTYLYLKSLLWLLLLSGCNNNEDTPTTMTNENTTPTTQSTQFVNVTKVKTSGSENNYNFSITIHSSDTGCDQYANWWEVITVEGDLLYRRILAHSHVDEQPFTRSGGPVKIATDQMVWIRAHMNTIGYGTKVFKGSIKEGFVEVENPTDFAKDLANQEPLPGDCAW